MAGMVLTPLLAGAVGVARGGVWVLRGGRTAPAGDRPMRVGCSGGAGYRAGASGPPAGRGSGERSSFLRILPVAVRGSASTKTTSSGTLYRAMSPRTWSSTSADVTDTPGRRTTNARGRSPHLPGHADHRGLERRPGGQQRVLHLDRRDVLAAGDDDVLGPVAELDVAVGVHDAEVAGVEPAAAEGLARWPPGPRSSRPSRCCRASRSRRWSGRRAGRRACRRRPRAAGSA